MDVQQLISMATDAMSLFGGKDKAGVMQKCISAFQAYQKYPKNMEGLQKALADANVTREQAQDALSKINSNPKLRSFIDNKFPGSLKVLEEHMNKNFAKMSATMGKPSLPTSSSSSLEIKELLKRAR